jgi:hypothetical protein
MRARRLAGLAAFAVAAAGLLWLAWQAPRVGQLAVDISAKWACQCRYIDGGNDASCVAEDPVGFGGTSFAFAPAERSVTVSIWGLVAATGRYEPGIGCRVR